VAYDYGSTSQHKLFYSPWQSFFDCLVMSVRNTYLSYPDLVLAKYAYQGRILLVCFLVIVAVILINLLIAMMAHTYNHTTELKREWLRQVGFS
jgi:hypothetical protein